MQTWESSSLALMERVIGELSWMEEMGNPRGIWEPKLNKLRGRAEVV